MNDKHLLDSIKGFLEFRKLGCNLPHSHIQN